MSELDKIRHHVLTAAQRPVVSRTWQRDALGLMLACFMTAAVSVLIANGLLDLAPQWKSSSAPLLAGTVVLFAVAAVTLTPWARRMRSFVVVAGAIAATLHVTSYGPWWPSGSLIAGLECAIAELAVAALPAFATVLTLRCFAHRTERAAMGGLAAAYAALLVLDLSCPGDGMIHALGFHLVPALVVAASVAVVRARLESLSEVP